MNLQVPADWTKLQTEGEVSAFLAMTRAKPISLLIVLQKSDGAPDTPVPTDPNPYFDKNSFAPVEMYDDPAEESNAVIRNAAGVASRWLPSWDHTFEECKYNIHNRIQRQRDALVAIKQAHL